MNNPNKILYIGAGCHIEPVSHLINTKEFVFIDTQPRNEFDSFHPKFDIWLYRKHFIRNLETECSNYGFIVDSVSLLDKKYFNKIISWKQYFYYLYNKKPNFINPTLMVFKNKKTCQTLKYYVSTNFQFNMHPLLKDDIATSDGIIVSGYIPPTDILKHFIKPKAFFGYTDTCYTSNETQFNNYKDDTIVNFLTNCLCNTQYYFKDFYMIEKKTGLIIRCINFSDFVITIEEHKLLYNSN
jgi:hypothetical protein